MEELVASALLLDVPVTVPPLDELATLPEDDALEAPPVLPCADDEALDPTDALLPPEIPPLDDETADAVLEEEPPEADAVPDDEDATPELAPPFPADEDTPDVAALELDAPETVDDAPPLLDAPLLDDVNALEPPLLEDPLLPC
ncbi:MAG: hypothetical protein AB2A00_00730 [Myxococcota bacterium]